MIYFFRLKNEFGFVPHCNLILSENERFIEMKWKASAMP
jgi:hypothetical protein